MKDRRRILVSATVGLLVLVGAALLWHAQRPVEPTYEGRPLSYWVERLSGANESEAAGAVRQMGTQGVPWLLKWIPYRTPPLREVVNVLSSKHQFLKRFLYHDQQKHERAFGAVCAFHILGSEATEAKPELLRLFKTKIDGDLSGEPLQRIAGALGGVAPGEFPVFTEGLSSQDAEHRLVSLVRLFFVETNAFWAYPTLLELFDDPDHSIRRRAHIVAGWPVSRGVKAVPYLQQGLSCRSAKGREWATNFLRMMAPATLTNVPPKPTAR